MRQEPDSGETGAVTLRCYVAVGSNHLELREKVTGRLVRFQREDMSIPTLLADCFAHGGSLTDKDSPDEYIGVCEEALSQSASEVVLRSTGDTTFDVHLAEILRLASEITSVWCYIEEYETGGGMSARLREKVTGRKVELWGVSKSQILSFLSSPRATGLDDLMSNVYEKDGYTDYVLVSGIASEDTFDSIRLMDGPGLTVLFGPTPETAYRDAYRMLEKASPAEAHASAARQHLRHGRYRAAILSARLSVEAAHGGTDGLKKLPEWATDEVRDSAELIRNQRHIAVHEHDTRIEQTDAERVVEAMEIVLAAHPAD